MVLQMLKGALENLPYEVISAQNAQEGLTLFHEHNPFLIILDMNMDGMNGMEVIQYLIKNEVPQHRYDCIMSSQTHDPEKPELTLRDADFHIVVLTGAGNKELMMKCSTLGVDYFLNKPIHLFTLRGIIENIHRLKTSRDELSRLFKKEQELLKAD